jgi:hypothetical protein
MVELDQMDNHLYLLEQHKNKISLDVWKRLVNKDARFIKYVPADLKKEF